MGDLAKIFTPGIKATVLKIRMRRAPQTEVNDRTGSAFFQELGIRRSKIPHSWHQIIPSLGKIIIL